MESKWNETMENKNNEKNQGELLKIGNMAKNFTKKYGILMYSTATMYFLSPFLGMQKDDVRIRKYPFFGWYYFDRFSDWYYALCYFSQVNKYKYLATLFIKYFFNFIFFLANKWLNCWYWKLFN